MTLPLDNTPGSKLIRPATYNKIATGINDYNARRTVLDADKYSSPINRSWIEAYNDLTSANLPFASVVLIGPPVTLPTDNQNEFETRVSHKIDLPETGRCFGITMEAIPDGKFGKVCVTGVASVQVDVQANHLGANWTGLADVVDADETKLESSERGVKVLWVESQDASGNPDTSGVQWARVALTGTGVTGSAADCDALHTIHGIPDTPSTTKYVPVYTTTGQCESVEIVECGTDATPPCSGCTGSTPTYYLLSISGASLALTDPSPENSFDIQAGSELLMQRTARCTFAVTLEYYQFGDTYPGGGPPHNMTITLTWDSGNSEWVMSGSLAGFDFTPIAGPLDCQAGNRCYSYSGTASGPAFIPGYDFTGMQFCISPRVTVL